jgi:hypothetical protein
MKWKRFERSKYVTGFKREILMKTDQTDKTMTNFGIQFIEFGINLKM